MATGGGDVDSSAEMFRDTETENSARFMYNVPVSNRYERDGQNSGWGMADGFRLVDRSTKRRRINTGEVGISAEMFQMLPTDGKLVVIFDMMNNIQVTQATTSDSVKSLNNMVANACRKSDTVEEKVDFHTNQLKVLSYRSIDLEARSRRNNLVFWGISERSPRNCVSLIQSFLTKEMRLDDTGMVIDRAHRLGAVNRMHIRNGTDPKRPLIVRFRDYRDTEHILENAYKLRRTNFRVERDYPKEIADARKSLYQSQEAVMARRKSQKVQILYPAKLCIEGTIVRDMFPDWADCMKQNRITWATNIPNTSGYPRSTDQNGGENIGRQSDPRSNSTFIGHENETAMEQDIVNENSESRDVSENANPNKSDLPPRSLPSLGFSVDSLLNHNGARPKDKRVENELSQQRTLEFLASALSNIQNSHAHYNNNENQAMPMKQSDLPGASLSNIRAEDVENPRRDSVNKQIHDNTIMNDSNSKQSETVSQTCTQGQRGLVSQPVARNFHGGVNTGTKSKVEHRGRTFVRAQSASSRSRSLMDRRDIIDVREIRPLEGYGGKPKSAGTISTEDHRDHGGNLSSSAVADKNESAGTETLNSPAGHEKGDNSVQPNEPV